MRKKWLSVALAVAMTASSFSPVLAESFDVSSEEALLEDSLNNGTVVDATEGIDVGGSDSYEAEGNFDDTQSSGTVEEPTDSDASSDDTVVSDENKKLYRVSVNASDSVVIFKKDLEALKDKKDNEVTDAENNEDDFTSSNDTTDAVNVSENNGYANVSSCLPSEYLSYIDESSYRDFIATMYSDFEENSKCEFYVVPFDLSKELDVKVSSESREVDATLVRDYLYSFDVTSNITLGVSYKKDDSSNEETNNDVVISDVDNVTVDDPSADITVVDQDKVDNAVEDNQPEVMPEEKEEESEEVECSCGTESENPYEHDFDCPVFTKKLLEDCSCGSDSEKIEDHDFDCQGIIDMIYNNCTCDAKDYKTLHDKCKLIEKLHKYFCDCGHDYDSLGDLYDTHSEDSRIIKYLTAWGEFINKPSLLARSNPSSLWGSSSIDYVTAFTSFTSSCAKATVSGNTKSNGSYKYGTDMTMTLEKAGYTYIGTTRTPITVKIRGVSSKGFCFNASGGYGGIDGGFVYSNEHPDGNNVIELYISVYNANTNKEIAVTGVMQLVDIDTLEGYSFPNGAEGFYTTSKTNLYYNTIDQGGYTSTAYYWQSTTNDDTNGNRNNSLQVIYKTAVGTPFHLRYWCETPHTTRGMSFTRDEISVNYHFINNPKGLDEPDSVYLASGANTKTGVSTYNLKPNITATGYTFSGWKLAKEVQWYGEDCTTNDIDLYGSFTARTAKWKVKKVDENGLSIASKDAKFVVEQVSAWGSDGKASKWSKVGDLTYSKGTDTYDTPTLTYNETNKGWFRIRETQAPTGYKAGWTSTGQSILQLENNYTFTAKNELDTYVYGTISIVKKDSVTGKVITDYKDAEFTIYEWDKASGTYKDTCEATAKGIESGQSGNNKTYYNVDREMYLSKNLYITDNNLGRFRVEETKNPTNYAGDWSQEFTLTKASKDGEPDNKSFEINNTPVVPPMGEITVNKVIKESDILLAHGNPTFRFTVAGTDSTWNEKHTWSEYVEFRPGNYKTDNSGNAIMSVTFKNIPVGTYEITEGSTLGYDFQSCSKVTSNVTENGTYLTATLTYNKDKSAVDKAEGTFTNKHNMYDNYRHTDVIKNDASLTWN